MDFLAESIGLLDLNGVCSTQQSDDTTFDAIEGGNRSSGGHITRSTLFVPWQEMNDVENSCGKQDSHEGERTADDQSGEGRGGSSNGDVCDKEHSDEEPNQASTPLEQSLESLFSPLSSLTANSPLTLSASSSSALNFTPRREQSTLADDVVSSLSPFNYHEQPSFRSNNERRTQYVQLAPKVNSTTPINLQSDSVLTKYVTKRIDSRTNYNCFTGNIDAMTGHLLHGTMLNRSTGEVYEGPFVTTTVPVGSNNPSRNGAQVADDAAEYETISMRHGKGATCRFSNGMKFFGAYEWDHPKSGVWMGGDWTYEGPLLVVDEDDTEQYNSTSSASSLPRSSSSSNIAGKLSPGRVIGIATPLPGSVLFHGTGRLIRSDGLVYEGEFMHGLANGVGRELLANGQGAYYGEFADGLRHDVGTLMENYEEGYKCDCEFDGGDESQGEERHHSREQQVVSRLKGENASTPQSVDNGPDFAAGGAPLSPIGTVSGPPTTSDFDSFPNDAVQLASAGKEEVSTPSTGNGSNACVLRCQLNNTTASSITMSIGDESIPVPAIQTS